ncbi:MAG: hypothetical protein PVG97_02450 [Syntrophobacterales bacterium]
MLIDRVLPKYDEREYHQIEIRGDRRKVYQTVRSIDFSHSFIIRTLFRMRGLPTTSTNLHGLLQAGFLLVDEIPPEEIVLGLVGKFWTYRAEILKLNAVQYGEFNQKGYAKLAWNFAIHDHSPGVVRLSTETRIVCTDDRSRSRFKIYWTLIGRFSGLTRKEMLRVVKRRMEGK